MHPNIFGSLPYPGLDTEFASLPPAVTDTGRRASGVAPLGRSRHDMVCAAASRMRSGGRLSDAVWNPGGARRSCIVANMGAMQRTKTNRLLPGRCQYLHIRILNARYLGWWRPAGAVLADPAPPQPRSRTSRAVCRPHGSADSHKCVRPCRSSPHLQQCLPAEIRLTHAPLRHPGGVIKPGQREPCGSWKCRT